MLNLSLDELKLISKSRGIKRYKSMSKDGLLSALIFDPEKDHYKPIKTASAFNNNYIQYKTIGDKDKKLTIKKYLDKMRPYLGVIINDHKAQSEQKIQLTMTINFFSSKDSEETHIMHTNSDNIDIMMGNETDEIIEELFQPLLQKYQEGLEELMKGRELIFDSVDLLYYNLNKISLNRGGSLYTFS